MENTLLDRPVKKKVPYRYLVPLILLLLFVAGVCGLFFRFGYHDSQAITGFSAAYTQYDQAMVNFSNSIFTGNESAAVSLRALNSSVDTALSVLQEKSRMRISSLTVNDPEIMETSREIGTLAGKEVQLLHVYQRGGTGSNLSLDELKLEFMILTRQRQSTYTHFCELAGLKN
jgi:hypothetical protein